MYLSSASVFAHYCCDITMEVLPMIWHARVRAGGTAVIDPCRASRCARYDQVDAHRTPRISVEPLTFTSQASTS